MVKIKAAHPGVVFIFSFKWGADETTGFKTFGFKVKKQDQQNQNDSEVKKKQKKRVMKPMFVTQMAPCKKNAFKKLNQLTLFTGCLIQLFFSYSKNNC